MVNYKTVETLYFTVWVSIQRAEERRYEEIMNYDGLYLNLRLFSALY